MTFETALVSVGLITVILLATEIMFTYATLGFGFGFSANRGKVEKSKLAIRIQRTYQNQVESTAYSVPILAAAAFIGLESSSAETAALVLVIARVAFAALYYTGIPFIRVPAFVAGTFSTIFIAYTVLVSGLL